MNTLVSLALMGAGVALVPLYLCRESLEKGKLVRVLPQWEEARFPVSIVSPAHSSSSARLKLVREALTVTVQDALR